MKKNVSNRVMNSKKNDNGIAKVSIIITVKDAEKNIPTCLESIFKQTLKELEILFVEGNSKDKTVDVIKEYQKKDSRIVLCTQDRPGIGAAKNYGIEHASGEYITFLDSDDYYMDEDALDKMYAGVKENDVKVCGAFRSVLSCDGNLEQLPLHRAFLIGFPKGRMFYYKDVQYDYHFHSYLYDRKMIVNSDARFAETRAYDDTHFFIRAMVCAKRFFVVPAELYCYCCHEGYAWKSEVCYEALESLIDQLIYTKNNNLNMCHYFAFQRLNYEYGPLFEKYAKQCDLKMLELLIKAQNEVSDEMIESVLKNPPTSIIIDPMNFPNCQVIESDYNEEHKYLVTPLANIVLFDKNDSRESHRNEINQIYNSKTYKIGRTIVWIPRKIFKPLLKR